MGPNPAESLREVVAKCQMCKHEISCMVPVKLRESYPFSFIYYHGQPRHAIILYLDAQYKVRGTETTTEVEGVDLSPAQRITRLMAELDQSIAGGQAAAARVVSKEISEILVNSWFKKF